MRLGFAGMRRSPAAMYFRKSSVLARMRGRSPPTDAPDLAMFMLKSRAMLKSMLSADIASSPSDDKVHCTTTLLSLEAPRREGGEPAFRGERGPCTGAHGRTPRHERQDPAREASARHSAPLQ